MVSSLRSLAGGRGVTDNLGRRGVARSFSY